jgi:hypothetical protein
MKIKITEKQAKRLNLLKESDEDAISVLHRYTIKAEQILTKIFNDLTNLSVLEIQNTNFDKIASVISEIEKKSRLLDKYANDYINSQPEDNNWELESRLTDASYEFNKKLTIIEDLNYKLSNLQEYMLENDIMSKFPPLDITNIQ